MPVNKIELIKKEEINGDVWYGIKVDGYVDIMSLDKEKVELKYDYMIERSKSDIYPKISVLKTNII